MSLCPVWCPKPKQGHQHGKVLATRLMVNFTFYVWCLQITNGPTFTINLTGTGVQPGLNFSFVRHDFGPCFLYRAGMPLKRTTLIIKNEDTKDIRLDVINRLTWLCMRIPQESLFPLWDVFALARVFVSFNYPWSERSTARSLACSTYSESRIGAQNEELSERAKKKTSAKKPLRLFSLAFIRAFFLLPSLFPTVWTPGTG